MLQPLRTSSLPPRSSPSFDEQAIPDSTLRCTVGKGVAAGGTFMGVLRFDGTGVVADVSAEAETVLALPRDACVGRPLHELALLDATTRDELRAWFGGGTGTHSLTFRTKTASLQLRASFVRLAGAHAGEALVIASLCACEAMASHADVEAHAQLRQTVAAVVGGFAHEVRNPLAAILSLSENVLAGTRAEDADIAGLSRIPVLVRRIDRLLRQTLEYGRPPPPNRAAHPAGGLVETVLESLAPATRARVASVAVGAGVRSAFVDLDQTVQVLLNVVQNASDAARSSVALRADAAELHGVPLVALHVSDDGCGVSPEASGRIFDPFFSTKAHGTGLGLAIARDLARLNGGDVRLARSSSAGSTFTVLLPATHARLQ